MIRRDIIKCDAVMHAVGRGEAYGSAGHLSHISGLDVGSLQGSAGNVCHRERERDRVR